MTLYIIDNNIIIVMVDGHVMIIIIIYYHDDEFLIPPRSYMESSITTSCWFDTDYDTNYGDLLFIMVLCDVCCPGYPGSIEYCTAVCQLPVGKTPI